MVADPVLCIRRSLPIQELIDHFIGGEPIEMYEARYVYHTASLLVVTKPALVLPGRVSVTQQPDEIGGVWYFPRCSVEQRRALFVVGPQSQDFDDVFAL